MIYLTLDNDSVEMSYCKNSLFCNKKVVYLLNYEVILGYLSIMSLSCLANWTNILFYSVCVSSVDAKYVAPCDNFPIPIHPAILINSIYFSFISVKLISSYKLLRPLIDGLSLIILSTCCLNTEVNSWYFDCKSSYFDLYSKLVDKS